MTGAEHYAEAERLLEVSYDRAAGSAEDMSLIAEAQVHATLALAAATALTNAGNSTGAGMSGEDYVQWRVSMKGGVAR